MCFVVFGWRALRPPRVVFVLGFVSKKWRDRCVRGSDGVAVGGAWAEGGLEGNSEQALGKVGQLEVWGAGAARWGLARRGARCRGHPERCGFGSMCYSSLDSPLFLFLFFNKEVFARAKQRKEREKKVRLFGTEFFEVFDQCRWF